MDRPESRCVEFLPVGHCKKTNQIAYDNKDSFSIHGYIKWIKLWDFSSSEIPVQKVGSMWQPREQVYTGRRQRCSHLQDCHQDRSVLPDWPSTTHHHLPNH